MPSAKTCKLISALGNAVLRGIVFILAYAFSFIPAGGMVLVPLGFIAWIFPEISSRLLESSVGTPLVLTPMALLAFYMAFKFTRFFASIVIFEYEPNQ